MRYILLLALVFGYGQMPDLEKILRSEAQKEKLALPARKQLKLATLKSKVKVKEAKSRTESRPEMLLYGCREVDIPRGLEFAENFTGQLNLSELVNFVTEVNLSEKYLGNRKGQRDKLSNTLKYTFGFNWKASALPIELNGAVKSKVGNSFEVERFHTYKFTRVRNSFEQVELKLKVKY